MASILSIVQGAESRRIVRIYPQPEQEDVAIDTPAFLRQLKSSEAAVKANPSARARISLAKEENGIIYRMMELPWETPKISSTESGVKPLHKDILWLPKTSPLQEIRVPFLVSPENKMLSFSDFDELWVDYQNFFPQDSCSLSAVMSMQADGEGGKTDFIAAGGGYALKASRVIDVAAAQWLEKDPFYLLRRKLGLAPDENWRIAQWGKFVVLQRRFHQDLAGIEAVDMAFQLGSNVEGVSLRLTTGDDYGPGELVELGKMTPNTSSMPGQEVIRADIQEILHQRFPQAKHIYLQEVVVILPGERWDVFAKRPFKSLAFQTLQVAGLADTEKARVQVLLERMESISADHSRLVVDIRSLAEKGDVKLRNGIIAITGKDRKNHCGIRLDKIRLVGLYNAQWPSFLLAGDDRKWGGPFLPALEAEKYVEWPRIEGYLPLEIFAPQKPRLFRGAETANIEIPSPNIQSQADILGVQGAFIRSDLPLRVSTATQEGLPLEGKGRWIELHWPISANITRDTYFFLGVEKGAEYISKGTLMLEFSSGQTASMGIVPNQPLSLDYGERKVKRAKLRLDIAKTPFALDLNELVLFRPVNLTPAQAFNEDRPVHAMEKLMIRDSSSSSNVLYEAGVGHMRGILTPAENQEHVLRWTTLFADPIDWIRGIRLTYNLPLAVAAKNPCWLNVTARWRSGSVSRDICVQQPSGELVLPISYFAERKGDSIAPEMLKSMDWRVDFGKIDPATEHAGAFDFDLSVEGIAMRALHQELQSWPLLDVGGDKISFLLGRNKQSMDEIVRHPIWVNLGPDAIKRVIDEGGQVSPLIYPHFKVESVVLESDASFFKGLDQEKNLPARSSYGRYILICLILLMGIWVSRNTALLSGIAVKLSAVSLGSWTGFWIFCALLLYAFGPFIPMGAPELAVAMTWGAGMRFAEPLLRKRHLFFTQYIYERPGTYYFVLGFIMIAATAGSLLFKGYTPTADSISFLAFYCLALGLSKEIWALRRA